MATLTSNLKLALIDDVSRKAGLISKALAAAEKQTRALAAASKAGLSDRMATQLQRIGTGARDIDRVTEAWQRYSRSQGLAASSSQWTKAQVRGVKEWERANLAAIRNVQAQQTRGQKAAGAKAGSGGEQGGGGGVVALARGYVGPALAAYSLKAAVTKSAEAERSITRIGITADASAESLAKVGAAAFSTAQEVAMPYAKVVQGLDTLVAQGRTLDEAMAFLPSVARTASAAGAEVDEIAKTAESVSSNFKIAGAQMQGAFDILAAGGKAGQFELKDMARYIPSLGPAAKAAGFEGAKGLSEMVSMLQILRKGAGTSEEASTFMANIFQKMETEETTKKFKKFGVDVPAAMKKARAEGRNLVEVFEDLTRTALKGDISKIPQLFADTQFAGGMRALMTYRGEWQKLSSTIQATAGGAVMRDLGKVTDNVQARLDRLANAYENRMRQIGSVLSRVLVPIDDKLNEITEGRNQTVNVATEALQRGAIDRTAEHELLTGERYGLTDERRPLVDARKEAVRRELVEGRLAEFDRDIAAKEAELAAVEGRTRGAGKARQDAIIGPRRASLDKVKAERSGLVDWKRGTDDLAVQVAEKQGERDRARKSLASSDPRYAPPPSPITPGLSSFGLGPNGTRSVMATGKPKPRAPTAQDAATLSRFEDIYAAPAAPQVDTTAITEAETKAKAAGETLKTSLGVTVSPQVDSSSVDALIAKVETARAGLRSLGNESAAAASASTGVVGRTMRRLNADRD